jgi:hypothetical protein
MLKMDRIGSRVPLLGVFAAGLVYALLPTGAFGAHDIAVRAAVTGAVAAFAAALIFRLMSRGHSLR